MPEKLGLAQQRGELAFQRVGPLAAHDFLKHVQALVEDAVGFARVHFVRADLIGNVVDDVADVQGVQDVEEEVEVHFQAGFRFRLVQSARLLKQQHAESIKARVAQCQAILGFVHAEAAGAAGAGGEENVTVNDLLLGQALLFQASGQTAQGCHGEVRGVALAVVAVFLAELEGVLVGDRQGFALVAETFQSAVDKLFMLPGEAAEENGGVIALGFGKGALHRLVELLNLPALQCRLPFPGAGVRLQAFAESALLWTKSESGYQLHGVLH